MAHAWKDHNLVQVFLSDVRQRLPFGQEQIDIMVRLVSAGVTSVNRILDLGSGDGILCHALLTQFPNAQCVLVDYSEPMLAAATKRFSNNNNLRFIQHDLSNSSWKVCLEGTSFDVVVSGYALHHLPHGRKYEIYKEIYDFLNYGGIFVNVEHVASVSPWAEKVSDEMNIDNIYQYLAERGRDEPKEILWERYNNRPDKADNILLSVDTQCDWLREIGFIDVDCFFKCFEFAVFAGRKTKLNDLAELGASV